MSRINGSALFFNEDEVRKTSNSAKLLPSLIRRTFFGLWITNEVYSERYLKFRKERHPGLSHKDHTLKVTADRKALRDENKLTFAMMSNVLHAMGYDVECVEIRLRERLTNKEYVFSTDDTVDGLKDKVKEDRKIGIESISL